MVRGGAGAGPRKRPFPSAFQRFLRCDTPRRTKATSIRTKQNSKTLPIFKRSRRRLALKRHWNVRGVLFWEIMYADDARTVLRSQRGLERMMAVSVEVFGASGLTIPEIKTETMCMPIPRAPATQIAFDATGQQQYRQISSFTYWRAPSKSQVCRPRLTVKPVQGR